MIWHTQNCQKWIFYSYSYLVLLTCNFSLLTWLIWASIDCLSWSSLFRICWVSSSCNSCFSASCLAWNKIGNVSVLYKLVGSLIHVHVYVFYWELVILNYRTYMTKFEDWLFWTAVHQKFSKILKQTFSFSRFSLSLLRSSYNFDSNSTCNDFCLSENSCSSCSLFSKSFLVFSSCDNLSASSSSNLDFSFWHWNN